MTRRDPKSAGKVAAPVQWMEPHPEGVVLVVRAHPGARRQMVDARRDDILKASVVAPPEKGKANKDIIALFAKVLSLPKSSFALLSGEGARQKRLLARGLSMEGILERLRKPG